MARSENFLRKSSFARFQQFPKELPLFMSRLLMRMFKTVPDNLKYNMYVSGEDMPLTKNINSMFLNTVCWLDDVVLIAFSKDGKEMFHVLANGILDEETGHYVPDELFVINSRDFWIRFVYGSLQPNLCDNYFQILFDGNDSNVLLSALGRNVVQIDGLKPRKRHDLQLAPEEKVETPQEKQSSAETRRDPEKLSRLRELQNQVNLTHEQYAFALSALQTHLRSMQ